MSLQNDWPWLSTVATGAGADSKKRPIKSNKWVESNGILGQKWAKKRSRGDRRAGASSPESTQNYDAAVRFKRLQALILNRRSGRF